MKEFKNVKITVQTHELLVLRAASLGMKKYALTDALLASALELEGEQLLKFVVNAQPKPPPTNTNVEQTQPKR